MPVTFSFSHGCTNIFEITFSMFNCIDFLQGDRVVNSGEHSEDYESTFCLAFQHVDKIRRMCCCCCCWNGSFAWQGKCHSKYQKTGHFKIDCSQSQSDLRPSAEETGEWVEGALLSTFFFILNGYNVYSLFFIRLNYHFLGHMIVKVNKSLSWLIFRTAVFCFRLKQFGAETIKNKGKHCTWTILRLGLLGAVSLMCANPELDW